MTGKHLQRPQLIDSIPSTNVWYPAILATPDVRRIHLQCRSKLLYPMANQGDLLAKAA